MKTKILPTHTCFDDMVETLVALLKAHPQDADLPDHLVLVHAIIHPEGSPRMAHAWLEDAREETVYFSGIVEGEKWILRTSRVAYYANTRPEDVTRYTYQEAFIQNRLSGHYGPWKPAYRALCRGHHAAES